MKILIATAALLLCLHAGAQKAPVFFYPTCLYTLSGLQASPSHKGIYICEGKKIVRKD